MEKQNTKSFLTHILNGINYMLPCVVAGGILMGLGYMFDDVSINPSNYGYNTAMASFFSTTGAAIFGMMLPVLTAGISYSFSGMAAIPAGLTGGVLCSQGKSGFLGALVAGFIVGYTLKILQKFFKKIPESLDGVKNLLLIPLFSVIIIGLASIGLLEPVVGAINKAMNAGLQSMNGNSKILLGLIVGAMQAIDMGGPVNKTAYLFAVAAMANGQYDIIAAVLAGGIVPPYVTAFATTLFKNKFTSKQRQTGMANYIIGLAGITEAAIPFWAEDPVRVILSCAVGSGLAGALSMAFGCSVMAPFGGIFILPLNSNIAGYIISIGSGMIVGTLLYGILGKKYSESTTDSGEL